MGPKRATRRLPEPGTPEAIVRRPRKVPRRWAPNQPVETAHYGKESRACREHGRKARRRPGPRPGRARRRARGQSAAGLRDAPPGGPPLGGARPARGARPDGGSPPGARPGGLRGPRRGARRPAASPLPRSARPRGSRERPARPRRQPLLCRWSHLRRPKNRRWARCSARKRRRWASVALARLGLRPRHTGAAGLRGPTTERPRLLVPGATEEG